MNIRLILRAIVVASVGLTMAMEVPTAASVLAMLKRGGSQEDAIQTLKSTKSITGMQLAQVPGVERYLHLFNRIRRFRIKQERWNDFVESLSNISIIRTILNSDCHELHMNWRNFIYQNDANTVNVVQVYHKIKELQECYESYQAILAIDNAQEGRERHEQELREIEEPAQRAAEVHQRRVAELRAEMFQEQQRRDNLRREHELLEQQRQEQEREHQRRQAEAEAEQRRQAEAEAARLRIAQAEAQQRRQEEEQRRRQQQAVQAQAQQPAEDAELGFSREFYDEKLQAIRASPYMRLTNDPCQTEIDRHELLETSFNRIMHMTPDQCKSQNWRVNFRGEDGIDVGGPKREFFTLVAKHLFNPDMALFECSASGSYTLQVHPLSGCKRDEWHMFKFAGRFLAMAAIHKQVIGTKFSSAFYKYILGHAFTLDDLKDIDADVHKNTKYILDNDPAVLVLTFTHSYEEFDVRKEVELKENGANIDVTDDNKAEYLQLLIDYQVKHHVSEQMDLICEGFFELIPRDIITLFDWPELQYLLAGVSKIDVADWKANTVYESCDVNHEVVIMFWDVVENQLNNQQRADLLQFVTSSPFVPITGFKDLQGAHGRVQKFNITFDRYTNSPAIVAHACFNQIVIPRHNSRAQFEEYLNQAILNKEGFGDI